MFGPPFGVALSVCRRHLRLMLVSNHLFPSPLAYTVGAIEYEGITHVP
ncbi:hypothetical protein SAMN05444421_11070 [Celeribacter marinus]|nr:hypothetical protein SAMN05444421_11070 [Celeribacter marinus]